MPAVTPTFAEFRRLASLGNVVPVYTTIVADLLSPVSAFLKLAPQIDRLPPRVEPDVDLDDAVFMYFANLVAFDHVQHRLFLIVNVVTEEGSESLRAKYDAALRELGRLERALARPLRLPRFLPPRG